MKKLAALLLALWLPMSAAAEAYSFSVSFTADEELFPLYMQETLYMAANPVSAEESEIIIRLVQSLLNGLSFDVQVQEQMMAVACSVGGKPLFDLSIARDEHNAYLTSSLLPGYAFVAEKASHTQSSALQETLKNVSWPALCEEAKQAAMQWRAGIEQKTEAGVFSGDAYDGGAVCKTWVLYDSDIAELVNNLLSQDVRALLNELAQAMGQADMLQQFDRQNAEVAEKDAHMYILRMVEDGQSELRGLSLTILRDMQQIATASLGVNEKDIKLVIGLGLTDQNYWWEFTAGERQRKNITSLTGISREWIADKELDFSYVSAKAAPVSALDWHCYITKSGKRYLWDAGIYEDNDHTISYLMSSDGKVNMHNGELDLSVSLGDAPYVPASVRVKFAAGLERAISIDGLDQVMISEDLDESKYGELIEKASALFAARLLKILPADLFLKLMQVSP